MNHAIMAFPNMLPTYLDGLISQLYIQNVLVTGLDVCIQCWQGQVVQWLHR